MIQTVEAIIETTGKVSLMTEVHLKENRRALVTILEESPKIFPKSKKENLRAVFAKMREAEMFSEIKNPREWQIHRARNRRRL